MKRERAGSAGAARTPLNSAQLNLASVTSTAWLDSTHNNLARTRLKVYLC